MKNSFDEAPYGFVRTKTPGFIKPAPSPVANTVRQIKAQNEKLESELAELKAIIADLAGKKSKK